MEEELCIVKFFKKIKCMLGLHDWVKDERGVKFCWNCFKLKNHKGKYN